MSSRCRRECGWSLSIWKRQEVHGVGGVDGHVEAVTKVDGRRAAADRGAVLDIVDHQGPAVRKLSEDADQGVVGGGRDAERFQEQEAEDRPPAFARPVEQVPHGRGQDGGLRLRVKLPLGRPA